MSAVEGNPDIPTDSMPARPQRLLDPGSNEARNEVIDLLPMMGANEPSFA
jgi:hypothetical protein